LEFIVAPKRKFMNEMNENDERMDEPQDERDEELETEEKTDIKSLTDALNAISKISASLIEADEAEFKSIETGTATEEIRNNIREELNEKLKKEAEKLNKEAEIKKEEAKIALDKEVLNSCIKKSENKLRHIKSYIDIEICRHDLKMSELSDDLATALDTFLKYSSSNEISADDRRDYLISQLADPEIMDNTYKSQIKFKERIEKGKEEGRKALDDHFRMLKFHKENSLNSIRAEKGLFKRVEDSEDEIKLLIDSLDNNPE